MELFKLFGTIAVNNSDANKALDETVNKGQQTQSKLSKFFSGVGKGAAVVGKTVATGLAVGATAMTGLTVKAMQAAGSLEQNMGGSQAVFGEYADKIQEKAKSAFSSMGLSTNDYLQTANKMGSLFKGAGFEVGEAMDLTSKAMQRASDVASIMGIDTSMAMESIAGAAKGNFTMMDNLGVAMNDTTLQAYAMEKGINKSTREMTNQEKIGLAMEMFLEKTADYAGNYAKENETLAGSLGTAKAAFQNFLDGSGDVDSLVQTFSGAINSIVRQLDELLPRLVTGLTDLVSQIIPMIPPLVEKVLPVIVEGATTLIDGIVTVLPTLLDAVIAALPMFIEGLTQVINGIIEALPLLIQSIVSALPTLIPQLIDGIVSIVLTLCEQFSSIIQPIIDALPDIIISLIEALMNNLPALIDGIITLVMGIVEAIPQIIQGLVDALPRIISLILTALMKAIPQIIEGLIRVVMGIVKAIPQIFASLKEGIYNVFLGIWDSIMNIFEALPDWFGKKFKQGKEQVTKAWSNIKDFFSNIKKNIVNVFSNIGEKLLAPFKRARDAIKKVADKIKGFFKGGISMPKIKLPKFSITPSGWKIGDLLKGIKPKLGITWAAKGGIFDEPTLFNTPSGALGVGEAGAEAVAPIDVLMGYVSNAVKSETNGLASRLDALLDILAKFFPEILTAAEKAIVMDSGAVVGALAPKMNQKLGEMQTANARGR